MAVFLSTSGNAILPLSRHDTTWTALVFYETYPTANEAIAREKQLKGWNRQKKKNLIQQMNPTWRNLLEDLMHGMMEIPEGD